MNKRDAILEGARAALRLHGRLGTRKTVEETSGCIDVFSALTELEVPLLFRPLDGLLGACLPGPARGVIISTQRPLHVQRFTGAHELGHIVLNHEASLDGDEILTRSIGSDRDLREVAADSFASDFLLPKWLLKIHARRQGWNRESMSDPHIVYQLALRVGASYQATCIALERHAIVEKRTLQKLFGVSLRDLKSSLLDGFPVDNYHPDVWLLTERDEGITLEGEPDDLFVIRLHERSGAGYLWTTNGLLEGGFAILRDTRNLPTLNQSIDNSIGKSVTRALTAKHKEPARGEFAMELRRPWQETGAPIARLRVSYELLGKEVGMPRAVRRQLRVA